MNKNHIPEEDLQADHLHAYVRTNQLVAGVEAQIYANKMAKIIPYLDANRPSSSIFQTNKIVKCHRTEFFPRKFSVALNQRSIMLSNAGQQEAYDEWAAEIDRSVKWAAVLLGPMSSIQQPIEETEAPPLSECIDPSLYEGIPTAKELYQILQDQPQLPLDQSFSNLVSRIASYMTLPQCHYVIHLRPSSHWHPFDLKRLRYVYSIKKKVHEIPESYGGLQGVLHDYNQCWFSIYRPYLVLHLFCAYNNCHFVHAIVRLLVTQLIQSHPCARVTESVTQPLSGYGNPATVLLYLRTYSLLVLGKIA